MTNNNSIEDNIILLFIYISMRWLKKILIIFEKLKYIRLTFMQIIAFNFLNFNMWNKYMKIKHIINIIIEIGAIMIIKILA